MLEYNICFLKSSQIHPNLWVSYCNSFNYIFNKLYDIAYFKHKYLNNVYKDSYHAFVLTKDDKPKVMGACTIIPYEYTIFGTSKKVGLLVDLFISSKYRKHIMLFKKLYECLYTEIVKDNIIMVFSSPNEKAFGYWTRVVGHKYIGNLKTFILPLTSCYYGKDKNAINILIRSGAKALVLCNGILSCILRKEKVLPIRIIRTSEFYSYRFTNDYKRINFSDGLTAYYKTYRENNLNICYLIDFYPLTLKCLTKTLFHIINNERVDIILKLGNMGFVQYCMFRVPTRLLPRKLPFLIDIIDKSYSENRIKDLSNWDFGLLNFDVR